MSQTDVTGATQDRTDRAVLCAKCEHLNAWGRNECKRCGAHLYISCTDCGHRNERVRESCTACGRRLHRGPLDRLRKKLLGSGRITATQMVLVAVGIALTFGGIVFLANISLPKF